MSLTRVIWQQLEWHGTEWCEIDRGPSSTRINGLAIVPYEGRPHRVEYTIDLDAEGRTSDARVSATAPGGNHVVSLEADGRGTWRSGGRVVVESAAALDLDLGFSPITNSLPIWRFGLSIGETHEIEVAWVLFPTLEVVHGRQSYERRDERTYVYRSRDFEADVRIFEDGLVDEYAGYWRAIARSEEPSAGQGG